MRLFSLFLVLMMVHLPAVAAERLSAGQSIPSDITLKNQKGVDTALDDLRGKKGMTIIFFRSADWCPYCQTQLIDLSQQAQEFEKAGYPLVGISYDSVEKLQKFDAKRQPGFTLLSDEGSDVIRAFGLFNEDHAKGTFAYGVPHPAVYIVGYDRTIRAVLEENGYKNRPTPEALMETIQQFQ